MDLSSFLHSTHSFNDGEVIFSKNGTIPQRFYYLARGHAMEFNMVNGERKVIRFIGGRRFLIKYSQHHNIMTLSEASVLSISYIEIVKLLKTTSETPLLHREIKKRHKQELKDFYLDLKSKSAAHRYMDLIEKEPWVLEEVNPSDIASYLDLSEEEYKNLFLKD